MLRKHCTLVLHEKNVPGVDLIWWINNALISGPLSCLQSCMCVHMECCLVRVCVCVYVRVCVRVWLVLGISWTHKVGTNGVAVAMATAKRKRHRYSSRNRAGEENKSTLWDVLILSAQKQVLTLNNTSQLGVNCGANMCISRVPARIINRRWA